MQALVDTAYFSLVCPTINLGKSAPFFVVNKQNHLIKSEKQNEINLKKTNPKQQVKELSRATKDVEWK